jgi:hypothetical protein
VNNDRPLYASTIFFSSALLFLLQPIMAKAILPQFGGSAGVWTTCMLFFQVVLLLGYLYANCLIRYLRVRTQIALHAVVLLASVAILPVKASVTGKLAGAENPVLSILALLTVSIGLPYFVLSTTGPLLQAWYAGRLAARSPYRLFALSNLASLAALLAYPLSIEPAFSVSRQLLAWSAAYVGFALFAGASALRSRQSQMPDEQEGAAADTNQLLLWVALAACASTLWLAVANHLSQEVAAIPFLWVLPLGIYLLSFILCFDRGGWYRPLVYRWILPVAWIAVSVRLALQGKIGGFQWEIALLSAALFVCCMFCHGELAQRKPEPRHGLTLFYLMIAIGGALGGVFVGFIAPHIFSSYLELPVGIAACIILGLALVYGFASPRHLARLVLVSVLAFVAATQLRSNGQTLLRIRNFYGTLQVIDTGSGLTAVRAFYSGTILHGMKFLAPERSRLPTTYFGPQSGVGLALAASHRRVGVLGLGVGTLAAYGRPGDEFRFYEINPAVIQAASAQFSFLRDSGARISVVAGDGRLMLEREAPQNFDVLVLDAFSGDSIPVHLLTTQALELYFRHLRPGGILAINVTNKYLDLPAVVQALAEEMHKHVLLIPSAADRTNAIYQADWAILADRQEALSALQQFSRPAKASRSVRPWTDDYSNLFQILK